jgi:hypothetical protein
LRNAWLLFGVDGALEKGGSWTEVGRGIRTVLEPEASEACKVKGLGGCLNDGPDGEAKVVRMKGEEDESGGLRRAGPAGINNYKHGDRFRRE